MEILKNRIGLRPIKNTKLIAITAYSEDKNEAAAVANAIAKSYQEYRVNLENKYELSLEASHIQSIQIVDSAEPSQVPVKPNKTLNIVAGAVYGIFLGVIIGGIVAWFAAKRQKRFDNHLPPR